MNEQKLHDAFEAHYHRPAAGVAAAPGRVNLIGEHTDYNDGFVLPIAIDKVTLAAWAPREDAVLNLASLQQPGKNVCVDLNQPITPGEEKWANYPKGVAEGLRLADVTLGGADILFTSDVPIGSGLSSSASLEAAAALAMLNRNGASMDGYALALLCQTAEHTFANSPCGIMDQAISILGRAGEALLLDCRDGSRTFVPFNDPDAVLLVCDTKVTHAISDGGYALRRQQCEEAAEILNIPALRDATMEQVLAAGQDGRLDAKHLMRARHVVGEIARTLQAVEAMKADDLAAFGELMCASHASLRDDYEVSCAELDAIVAKAETLAGVYGARMTGGGFGGCAIVLAKADQAAAITDAIVADFTEKFDHAPAVFTTTAQPGALERNKP